MRIIALWLLGLALPCRAAEFVLADRLQQVPPPPIVLPADVPPLTREAAETLASYLHRMVGSKPEVFVGEPKPRPARAIWVGMQPAVAELFPKLDREFRHPEEILIAANSSHLLIAGRDRWDPKTLAMNLGPKGVTGKQEEYGTVNAIYTFMQDSLGVRWFWPGETGVDIPKKDRIALAPFEYRYHPPIRSRSGVFNYSRFMARSNYGQSQEWVRFQRLQLDSLSFDGGHAFTEWWDKYHKQYPEIFALQPDGTRSGYPNPRNVKLCLSNPKVWELWLDQVAEQLREDPTRTVFNASPNDGWASGHCVCPNCRAWDHPDGEPRVFNWAKKNETLPALSDRDVTFANTLAGLLKMKYPDRHYRVMMLSYGHSRPAPVKARPADNVIMTIVANFLGRKDLVDRGSTRGETYRQQFDAWAKIVPSMFWRPNTGSPAGWQQGLPDLSIQQTIRDFQDVAAANCEGIFIDTVWEHWATQAPQYYMMAQLTWNAKIDAPAVLADFYQRAFGPAAPAVREYFETIEKERMAFTAKDKESGLFAFPKLYTPQLLADSQDRLDRAAQAVEPGSIEARRVAFIQAGLTYTQLLIEIIRQMNGYWQKKTKDEAVAATVRQLWEQIEKHVAAHPHAINWGPVRPITPRMAGLHPDYPPKTTKRLNPVELDQ